MCLHVCRIVPCVSQHMLCAARALCPLPLRTLRTVHSALYPPAFHGLRAAPRTSTVCSSSRRQFPRAPTPTSAFGSQIVLYTLCFILRRHLALRLPPPALQFAVERAQWRPCTLYFILYILYITSSPRGGAPVPRRPTLGPRLSPQNFLLSLLQPLRPRPECRAQWGLAMGTSTSVHEYKV